MMKRQTGSYILPKISLVLEYIPNAHQWFLLSSKHALSIERHQKTYKNIVFISKPFLNIFKIQTLTNFMDVNKTDWCWYHTHKFVSKDHFQFAKKIPLMEDNSCSSSD